MIFLFIPSNVVLKAGDRVGAAFLKIGVGAKAIGMAGAYTAVSNDATALYWNPAGIAGLHKKEFSLMHAEHIADMGFDFAGFTMPVGKYGQNRSGTMGVSFSKLSQTDQEGRGDNREQTGSFKASDMAFAMSYARPVMSNLYAGSTLKLIKSSIGNDSANAMALDIGGMYHMSKLPVSLGLAVRNISHGIKYINEVDYLPLTFALGAAYLTPLGLSASVEFTHMPYDGKNTFSMGTEYLVLSKLALRAGYMSNGLGNQYADAKGFENFVGGLGLGLFNYRLDYSFVPFGPLGNVQRFSISSRF